MISQLMLIVLAAVGAPGEALPQPVEWTVAPHTGGGGRVLFVAEAPLLELARDPAWAPSYETRVTADEKGVVAHEHLGNGWAHCALESPDERTVLVEGRGFYLFFVNGDRCPGDPYRRGIRWPIRLRKGTNHLLVRGIRGKFEFRLLPAEGPASLVSADATLPDLREGQLLERAPGAVVVLNHGVEPLEDAVIVVGDDGVFARRETRIGSILPLGLGKPPFKLVQKRQPKPDELDEKDRYALPVTLRVGDHEVSATYRMKLRKAGEAYVETRISKIDFSVQEHAVRAPVKIDEGKTYALFLSVHGAGVRCHNQARAYKAKEDAFVVAPTNRREFGFDWQDWGRLDALECLDWIQERYPIDPDRVVLTGHSMGGHGAWYLGCLYPDRFAAVCPSAGWSSFFNYGGGLKRDLGDSPVLDAFERAQNESDTELLVGNLERTPVYVLHGEKDDNVPVSEARRMIAHLAKFHRSFVYHEEPGAGHWWGNECVDWPPLIEFGLRHRRDTAPTRFRFTTVNPAVNSRHAWARILCQIERGRPSTIEIEADVEKRRVVVKTENVETLQLSPAVAFGGGDFEVEIDGTGTNRLARGTLSLDAKLNQWHDVRRPAQQGPFKLAWRNRMTWIYGTNGTPEENAAILAKVRYDAAVWWYRGNGHVRILSDRGLETFLWGTRFTRMAWPDHNVILYGNATTNSAFERLLDDCPIRVERGRIVLGEETLEGDLGAYLVYPAGGHLVGVVGATTAKAMRMAQQARYFISGAAVPDWVIFDEKVLREGITGVLDAGYFTNDWKLGR